jgi:hypothetical protein
VTLCGFGDGSVKNWSWQIPKKVVAKVGDGVSLRSLERSNRRDHDSSSWWQNESTKEEHYPKHANDYVEVV